MSYHLYYSTVLNLGRPSVFHLPQLATDGNGVVITYTGGDKCGNVSYTTKIMLSCSNASTGVSTCTLAFFHTSRRNFFQETLFSGTK